ncbi:isomerase [Leuconostoc mesenteroides P45]|uniref:ASCH domain-containing protein n=1 Tax=Leuconostoc mesenteroides TaxID=1245 RepID=UPI00050343B5|nr:ASCH domain-containing protein [Leuconostoc mesenteroides]KGB50793.1 isomerase [Leuconostoc mesenteroides P45]
MLMGLNHDQFILMKAGTKKIEIRLNDAKRSSLKENDKVTFVDTKTDEQLAVIIEKIYKFKTFKELYSYFNAIEVGGEDGDSVNKMVEDTYTIYSPEQEQQFGVLALKVGLVK